MTKPLLLIYKMCAVKDSCPLCATCALFICSILCRRDYFVDNAEEDPDVALSGERTLGHSVNGKKTTLLYDMEQNNYVKMTCWVSVYLNTKAHQDVPHAHVFIQTLSTHVTCFDQQAP